MYTGYIRYIHRKKNNLSLHYCKPQSNSRKGVTKFSNHLFNLSFIQQLSTTDSMCQSQSLICWSAIYPDAAVQSNSYLKWQWVA